MNRPSDDWLERLADETARCVIPADSQAQLAAHVQTGCDESGREIPEISLFYGATEYVGGPRCGRRKHAPFWLDLASLSQTFDRIDEFAWQAAPLADDDDLGAHVAIKGLYAGKRVRVQVLSRSPKCIPAAETITALGNVAAMRW